MSKIDLQQMEEAAREHTKCLKEAPERYQAKGHYDFKKEVMPEWIKEILEGAELDQEDEVYSVLLDMEEKEEVTWIEAFSRDLKPMVDIVNKQDKEIKRLKSLVSETLNELKGWQTNKDIKHYQRLRHY
jgi:hypothetical protein